MMNLHATSISPDPASDADSILIDESVMAEFKQFMGDEADDMVKELFELYLKSTPGVIEVIGSDIRANDYEALKKHVHGLKGSSAQLGFSGISGLCRKIEIAIQEEKFDEIFSLFEKMLLTYKETEKLITDRLTNS
jgi:HPt (histidine-containing phosphotransfer) domain-containing protein